MRMMQGIGQRGIECRAETYALVPTGVGKRDLLAERLECLRLLFGRLGLCNSFRSLLLRFGRRSWRGRRLRLRVERADLQLLLVLLQNPCIVVFPELLGRILAADFLENLLAAGVVVLEFGHVIHVTINHDE